MPSGSDFSVPLSERALSGCDCGIVWRPSVRQNFAACSRLATRLGQGGPGLLHVLAAPTCCLEVYEIKKVVLQVGPAGGVMGSV
jgi:hypothetical protein